MANNVWFGLHVPPEGRDFQEMKNICQIIEQSRWDLFTVTDHFMNIRDPNGPGNHPLECWSTLAGLAAVTEKIKLSPLVSCYGYRRPTVLAKMATTVDIISKGRLIFGIGAGWHEEEFKGFMGRFPPAGERLQGLRETVEICKQMFANKYTTYPGKLYQVDNVLNSPQPIQKPIPIMIGGGGERVTLKIAAKYADICHFLSGSLNALKHKLSILEGHCKTIGRNSHEIRKATSMGLIIGKTKEEAEQKFRQRAEALGMTVEATRNRWSIGEGIGTLDMVAEAVQEYVNRGIGLIMFYFKFTDLESIRLFSEEILHKFR